MNSELMPDLPHCVICDLDGTLCLLNGRNPYDASTCESDLLNAPVHDIIAMRAASGDAIIFMSGREEKYREQTLKWFNANSFLHVRHLYMRATGDNRRDSIVKQELYERHVLGKFNVRFVLDDRNQVVELWRSLGLTCFQVADGDF